MCSWSVNALLRCSIKRRTLIVSSSLEAPLSRAGWTEDVVQVLISSTYDYIWSTCLGLLVLGSLLLFICNALDLEVTCLELSMQRSSIHPYAYRTRILLLPLLLLLLLFHCCCCCCYY